MDKIAKILLELKAVSLNTKEGFLYTSGRKGPIYCDNRLILSNPEERKKIVNVFAKIIKKCDYDVIAGVATAGVPWATLVAEKLKKPLIYVRSAAKEHGKNNKIEGRVETGKRVIVMEDLINTGGSSVDACNALKEAGMTVVACIAIFDYGLADTKQKFEQTGVPLLALSDFKKLLKTAMKLKYITDEDKTILLQLQKNSADWQP